MPGTVRWAKRNSVSESVSTAQWERLLADLERLFADPERLSAGRLRPFAVESTHLLFATSQQSESNGARFFHPIPNTQQHPFILSFIQVFPQSQCQLPPLCAFVWTGRFLRLEPVSSFVECQGHEPDPAARSAVSCDRFFR